MAKAKKPEIVLELPEFVQPDAKKKIRRQIHVSGVNMHATCAQRFAFRYIENIKLPPRKFMLRGTGVDRAVNADLDNKIETGELLPTSVVLEAAADAVEKKQKQEPIELEADDKGRSVQEVVDEVKDEAVRLVTCHHTVCAPTLRPIRTARRFSINLDDFLRDRAKRLHDAGDAHSNVYAAKVLHAKAKALNAAAREGLDFVGEQDIVEKYSRLEDGADGIENVEHLVIRDTKTSSKSPAATTADDSDQLTAYALASNVIDGKLPDVMALDYLVDLKRGAKYVEAKTTRSLADVETFLNRLEGVIHSIHTGVFTPTNADAWQCSQKWCGYADRCPYFKQPKLVQIGGVE